MSPTATCASEAIETASSTAAVDMTPILARTDHNYFSVCKVNLMSQINKCSVTPASPRKLKLRSIVRLQRVQIFRLRRRSLKAESKSGGLKDELTGIRGINHVNLLNTWLVS